MRKYLIFMMCVLAGGVCAEDGLIAGKDIFPEEEGDLPEATPEDDSSDDSDENSDDSDYSQKKLTPQNKSGPQSGKDIFPEEKSPNTSKAH